MSLPTLQQPNHRIRFQCGPLSPSKTRGVRQLAGGSAVEAGRPSFGEGGDGLPTVPGFYDAIPSGVERFRDEAPQRWVVFHYENRIALQRIRSGTPAH